jgi:hypothetical protein
MPITRRLMIAGGAAALLAQTTQPSRTALAQAQPRAQSIPRGTAPAETDVRLGDTLFSANDPAAVWQYAGADTVRIFLRKGAMAVIWYLQQRSPIDGKPFHVVVVERQRWTNLAAEVPASSYQATAFGRSFPVYGHGDFQRWVTASRPFPMSDTILNEWQKRGWMLPWGIGPKLQSPGNWGWLPDVKAYSPLATGGITPAMGTTGLRDEIGPIIHRQARYIMERSNEMRAISLNYGLSSASIPWHVRGNDGLPLLLDDPRSQLKLQQYYQNYPEEKIISVSPGMQNPWDIDNAHRPNAAFLPALLTGLHPFFVEQQLFSACAALNSVAPSSRGPSGRLVDQPQGRDWAWSMRDMVLAHALLKSMGRVDWLPAAERFDAIISANLDRAVNAMATPGMGALGMFWSGTADDAPANPTFWAALRNGNRVGIYTGGVANYTGFVLDWGRRLHPDPRWLQLQVQYAERFLAQRVLATGPYAFVPLPARVDGRWASSWAEVARSVRLPANIATARWSSFDRPTTEPSAYPYSTELPAMVYNGLKLAQSTGRTNADVDSAIALLEAQMQGRAAESWPAFSMRHAR